MQQMAAMGRADRYTSFSTLTDAIAAFDARGYLEIFRADPEGLRASHEDRIFPPSELQVDGRARIEGDSNPDEETIVFALRDPKTDLKGTFIAIFGPNVDPIDAAAIQSLECDRLTDRAP